MLSHKNRIAEIMVFILLFAILAAFLSIFTLINFNGFEKFCNSDMYADTLVSKLMWEQKTIFPEGWTFGNQFYVVATPVIAALFYGITGSMNLSMIFATTAMTLLMILALWWMLRPFAKPLAIMGGVVAMVSCIICPKAVETIEGQIFYIMASYYACYAIAYFVVLGDYARALQSKKFSLSPGFWLAILLSFATGMQSLRQTAVMILPICAFELLRLISAWRQNKHQLTKQELKKTLRVALYALANLGGLVFIKLLRVPNETIYSGSTASGAQRVLESWQTDIRAMLGISGLRAEEAGRFIMALSLVLLVFLALFFVLRQRFGKAREPDEKCAGLSVLISISVISLLAVLASNLVLRLSFRSIYLFVWYLLVSICVVYLLQQKNRLLQFITLATVCVCAVTNLFVSYLPSYRDSLDPAPTTGKIISDWIIENDYDYLYGEWTTVGIIASQSDGEFTAGSWTKDTFHILPYINPLDIYSEENNERAVYLITDDCRDEAFKIAEQRGADFRLIDTIWGYEFYESSAQLMYK
ncbi:MAG: hypothetical protein RSB65_07870 [Oscillospiraceae bacterium]